MDLRIAVTEKLFRDNGIAYDPGAEILITDGATMGIYAALMATLNEGDACGGSGATGDACGDAISMTGMGS